MKIDVAVNAPASGTIKEFLAKEEDTVTVGQELVVLELGSQPEDGKTEQAAQKPKEPAPESQSTSSDPKPEQKDRSSTQTKESSEAQDGPPTPEARSSRPQQPRKSELSPPSTPKPSPKTQSQPPDHETADAKSPIHGGREERRVRIHPESRLLATKLM